MNCYHIDPTTKHKIVLGSGSLGALRHAIELTGYVPPRDFDYFFRMIYGINELVLDVEKHVSMLTLFFAVLRIASDGAEDGTYTINWFEAKELDYAADTIRYALEKIKQ